MAQAGKLFDKKHGGSGAGGGQDEAKVQGVYAAFLRFHVVPFPLHLSRTRLNELQTAMHSAATTIMRLLQSYSSTGKVDLQPGEMQGLISTAMSFI
jgi:hypothetical protein